MIDMVTKAAEAGGKPVGVCGEAAADPLLALALAGLGYVIFHDAQCASSGWSQAGGGEP